MGLFVVADSSLRTSSSSVRRTLHSGANLFERHPAYAFALLTLAYLLTVTVLSHNKLLWLDELITLHIAKLGSSTAIWNALAHAADPNPPLTHLAVLASLRIFGEHEFALRLPAILGYWIGLLSIFLFLRRRLPVSWAMAGTILSMSNAAFDYSYESRSYGILYGMAMLAILCWSRTVDPALSPHRRRLALCGMTLALAAGLCANYFSVLAFFPIAGGELVRSLRLSTRHNHASPIPFRRSLDLRIWTALGIAATPLLAFRPLIQRSIAQFAPHAWNKVSLDQVFDSYTEMVEVILFPVVALLALALAIVLLSRLCSHCRSALRPRWLANLTNHHAGRSCFSIPLHEAAATLLLMLYPFLGYLLAHIRGGMLSPRFVIPVCLGFAITGIFAGYRVFGHLPYSGAIAIALCCAVFLGRTCAVGEAYHQQKQCFYQVLHRIPVSTHQPIVVADPLMVLTLAHYAPPSIASRIVFPVDFPAIRFYRGEDSPEENLWAGRPLYHLAILPLADFQSSAADYLILASDRNWLIRDLASHNYPVHRLPGPSFPAGAIKGFTPLNHGDPVFFLAAGDRSFQAHLCPMPRPFQTSANLPDAGVLKPGIF